MKSITFPEGVTEIGDSAFNNINSLESINFSSTVTKIGAAAFNDINASYVTIPDTVTEIGDGAFSKKYTGTINLRCSKGSAAYNYAVNANNSRINYVLPFTPVTITNNSPASVYSTQPIEPDFTVTKDDVTLKNGTDYKVTYSNNINAGTAIATITGIGHYEGNQTANFTINSKSISDATVELPQESYKYNRNEIFPIIEVYNENETLKKDVDYTVAYANNKHVGTASITVTGIGNYTGTITKTFEIEPNMNIEVADITNIIDQTYLDGTEIKPIMNVLIDGKRLLNNRDFTITYSQNKLIGTGKVKITAKGKYEGEVEKTFTIKARTSKVVKAPSIIGRQSTPYAAVVAWVPNFSVNGTEVMYADNESFTNAKTQVADGYGMNFKAIDNNSLGGDKENGYDNSKTLYVKIRSYIVSDGEKIYSDWSSVRTVNKR